MDKLEAAKGIYNSIVDQFIADNCLNPESQRAMTRAQEMACGVLKNNYIYGRGWLRMAEIGSVAGISQHALRFRLVKFEAGMMDMDYANHAAKLWRDSTNDLVAG